MSDNKPALPMVLGSGPLADEMRAMIAADPDRYRPSTWSTKPVGTCPCCNQKAFRCRTRFTNFEDGFSTHADVVHPSFNPETQEPDPRGTVAGCCCVPGQWGPKHREGLKPKRTRKGSKR